MQGEAKTEDVKRRELETLFIQFIKNRKPSLSENDQNNTPDRSDGNFSINNIMTKDLFYETKAPYFVRQGLFTKNPHEKKMINVLEKIDYTDDDNSNQNMKLLTTLFLDEREKTPCYQHDIFKQINEKFNKWREQVTPPRQRSSCESPT